MSRVGGLVRCNDGALRAAPVLLRYKYYSETGKTEAAPAPSGASCTVAAEGGTSKPRESRSGRVRTVRTCSATEQVLSVRSKRAIRRGVIRTHGLVPDPKRWDMRINRSFHPQSFTIWPKIVRRVNMTPTSRFKASRDRLDRRTALLFLLTAVVCISYFIERHTRFDTQSIQTDLYLQAPHRFGANSILRPNAQEYKKQHTLDKGSRIGTSGYNWMDSMYDNHPHERSQSQLQQARRPLMFVISCFAPVHLMS